MGKRARYWGYGGVGGKGEGGRVSTMGNDRAMNGK